MGLDGVEIFTNSSGSHHELRKLYRRVELIKEATLKVFGLSSYAFHLTLNALYFSLVVFIYMLINKDVTETVFTTTDAL